MPTRSSNAPILLACSLLLLACSAAKSSDAPEWMHALASAPTPDHDATAGAVELYSEQTLTVLPNGKVKSHERRVYRVLRPDADGVDVRLFYYAPQKQITALHAWTIPASGKDYAVKDKEIVDLALQGVRYGELMSDLRMKGVRFPAATPGAMVGYEIERELQLFQDLADWTFQGELAVREAHFTLNLPAGWSYQTTWDNFPAQQPVSMQPGSWTWTVTNLPAVPNETAMPPLSGVAGHMTLTFAPPNGAQPGLVSWQDIGQWQAHLDQDRDVVSPEMRAQVAALTVGLSDPLARARALASFVQRDIRYVAIELGIGGWQPHAASEVFAHRYGDCKDKSMLLGALLREIGIQSYQVVINVERGAVTDHTPPDVLGFDHVILAIQLPEQINDPSLQALYTDPKLGRLLFFDPTNDLVPFGTLAGPLQANFGLLVTPEGGELVRLPQLAPPSSAIERSGHFQLDENGALAGSVHEIRRGDPAWGMRASMLNVNREADRIKPLEVVLADSLTASKLSDAQLSNATDLTQDLIWDYKLQADKYAKQAGALLLVRPRVLGSKVQHFWEPERVRQNPIEYEGPQHDTDVFEIEVPADYVVDELPPPVNIEEGGASYHSRTEFRDHVLRYTRSYEIHSLSVPANATEALRHFYSEILGDERNAAVLRRTSG